MARNGVHSGGRTKAEYYKVWDKETGIYKGVWRIGARQRKMPSLFKYERVSPAKVTILKIDEEKNQSRLEITIHQGKNRQVRKMCEAIGHKVLALHRSKIAGIDVKDVPLGKWRYLNSKEVNKIKM